MIEFLAYPRAQERAIAEWQRKLAEQEERFRREAEELFRLEEVK
jgi:hypothetical protein